VEWCSTNEMIRDSLTLRTPCLNTWLMLGTLVDGRNHKLRTTIVKGLWAIARHCLRESMDVVESCCLALRYTTVEIARGGWRHKWLSRSNPITSCEESLFSLDLGCKSLRNFHSKKRAEVEMLLLHGCFPSNPINPYSSVFDFLPIHSFIQGFRFLQWLDSVIE
jgi:hypothetical protein